MSVGIDASIADFVLIAVLSIQLWRHEHRDRSERTLMLESVRKDFGLEVHGVRDDLIKEMRRMEMVFDGMAATFEGSSRRVRELEARLDGRIEMLNSRLHVVELRLGIQYGSESPKPARVGDGE